MQEDMSHTRNEQDSAERIWVGYSARSKRGTLFGNQETYRCGSGAICERDKAVCLTRACGQIVSHVDSIFDVTVKY